MGGGENGRRKARRPRMSATPRTRTAKRLKPRFDDTSREPQGVGGWPLARRLPPPCVTLIDLALPPSDGLELLREMRAQEQTRLLPVVVFCSGEERPQVDEVYASGANSYIRLRPGYEPFEESIREVAHYWCVVNDPPPPL
jgi:CheY-like chemotaxis protein